MPLTTLDPATALVVVDIQKMILGHPTVHPIAEVVERAAALARRFRALGKPVVLVNVAAGAPGRTEQPRRMGDLPLDMTAFVPELEQAPQDLIVTKRTWGAFAQTDLEARLRAAGVTQIVLAGVATSIGVESTAREAYSLGFNVTLAVDAMTDVNPDCHANSVERIFPRLGETGLTADLLRLLDPNHA